MSSTINFGMIIDESRRNEKCFVFFINNISCYLMQDPGTEPVERHWPSIDLGTEIYISGGQLAEWTVSNFDIIIPKDYAY